MVDNPILALEPRQVTGKKVRALRRQGIVPANVFGRGLASVSVQAPHTELISLFRSVARNTIIDVEIAGESEKRSVVLRGIQRHPVSRELQHVDFFQIDVNRPIQAAATLVIVGQSEAVAQGGVLVQILDQVSLEALPSDMPSELTVDISGIEHFHQSIHISDLELPAGVRVLTDPTVQIVTLLAPRLSAEDEAEEAAREAAAAEAEAPADEEGEPAEGATPDAETAESPGARAPRGGRPPPRS